MVVYKCRVCGLPKKGHICYGAPPATNASSSGSTSVPGPAATTSSPASSNRGGPKRKAAQNASAFIAGFVDAGSDVEDDDGTGQNAPTSSSGSVVVAPASLVNGLNQIINGPPVPAVPLSTTTAAPLGNVPIAGSAVATSSGPVAATSPQYSPSSPQYSPTTGTSFFTSSQFSQVVYSRLGERGGDAAPPFCTCGPVWVTPSKSQPRTGHNARTRFETAEQRTEKPLTNTRESTVRPTANPSGSGEALLYNKK